MSMEQPSESKHKPATGSEIREILGPAADIELVSSILHTRANRNEIAQACAWMDDDDYMGLTGKPMSPRMRNIYDILLTERDRDHMD